jgi:hypothetical protein
MLHTTGSAIGGSAALWMLLTPCIWRPQPLEIYAPKSQVTNVVNVLQLAGFGATRNLPIPRHHREFIYSRCCTSGGYPTSTAIITESTSPIVLLPLLVSSNTSQMNLVSPHEILCIYPTLTLHQTALSFHTRGHTTNHSECAHHNITLPDSNESWSRPCLCACPIIWRRTNGMRGMAVFLWEESKKKFLFQTVLNDTHYSWTLGTPCKNPNCPNRT